MTVDSFTSYFTIDHVQCASHALVHSPWKNHPDVQDKSSFQLGGMHYSLRWIAQIDEPSVDNPSLYKEPMTWIFYATSNAPKSCTMQVMGNVYA